MTAELRISAKTLGELAMPDFCPRCFWIKLHAGKLPFQIFPGIFSSIDAYTKRIIHCYIDDHECFPSWLDDLGELVGYKEPPHYTKFKILDSNSGVTLWGTPDGVFTKADGSHVIVDYKTAKYTGTQDKLMPMYEVQLNAYAAIGEKCGLKPVSDLALIYMEPVTDADAATDGSNHRHNGFAMGFSANIHKVALNLDTIPLLLARVREIYELSNAPEGSAECNDCYLLESLLKIASG
jgi:hypothetical protein